MYIGVEDIYGVPGVEDFDISDCVALGFTSVVYFGVPGKFCIWVNVDVEVGIPGVVAAVFSVFFFIGYVISVPGKYLF